MKSGHASLSFSMDVSIRNCTWDSSPGKQTCLSKKSKKSINSFFSSLLSVTLRFTGSILKSFALACDI